MSTAQLLQLSSAVRTANASGANLNFAALVAYLLAHRDQISAIVAALVALFQTSGGGFAASSADSAHAACVECGCSAEDAAAIVAQCG